MSIGIIAEYNPFHNGHIRQLKYAKKHFPDQKIIIFMSNKFVQRGELAIATFKERAKFAKKYGASEVIPLPTKSTIQAAHIFAEEAVLLANKHRISKLLFGSESDDPSRLIKIAKLYWDKQPEYKKILKSYLKQGWGFPKANNEAIKQLLNESIDTPNDILGIEYVKTIVKHKLPIEPITIKRNVTFHSQEATKEYASASYIRQLIFTGDNSYKKYTPMRFEKRPEQISDYYKEFQRFVIETDSEELSKINLVSEGLERRFKKFIAEPTYELFINKVNSKRHTSSRIKRIILQMLLESRIIQG